MESLSVGWIAAVVLNQFAIRLKGTNNVESIWLDPSAA